MQRRARARSAGYHCLYFLTDTVIRGPLDVLARVVRLVGDAASPGVTTRLRRAAGAADTRTDTLDPRGVEAVDPGVLLASWGDATTERRCAGAKLFVPARPGGVPALEPEPDTRIRWATGAAGAGVRSSPGSDDVVLVERTDAGVPRK